jgi:hypothetical protein
MADAASAMTQEAPMPNRTQEVVSRAAGAMKAVKATVKGFSGIFKQLTREHGEVSALLMRVKMTSDPLVRRELYPTIRSELLSHERGELRAVYPAFLQYKELEGIARAHEQEAGQLERLINELNTIAYDDDAWGHAFMRLVELVMQHTKEEENEYFPKANRVLGEDVANRLKANYEAAKNEARPITS